MPNTLLTPTIVAKEALMLLENNLKMADLIYRPYENEFAKQVNGYKVGSTIQVRKPNSFTAIDMTSGVNISSSYQDVTESFVNITIDKQVGVPFQFTSQEMTLKISDFNERILKPAVLTIAQKIETDIFAMYTSVSNFSGTAGTVPNSYDAVGGQDSPPVIMSELAVPEANRYGALSPRTMGALASSLKGYFAPAMADSAMKTGMVGKLAGIDLFEAQTVPVHTAGLQGGSGVVAGTITPSVYPATATDVTTSGWSNSITGLLRKGDIITFAGVFGVNPRTLASTGRLQTFVVNADVNSNGSGLATVNVSPALITTGAFRKVTNVPAANAAITVRTGTSGASNSQNLFFHKNAFALAMVDLELPTSAAYKARETYKGLSMRIVADYDVKTDVEVYRLECLYGVAPIYPELACRLTS